MKDEREAVLLALLSYEKKETFSNVLVRRTLDGCAEMTTAERAFIKRLLEGVIERKTELDAVIERYTGRSVSRLHPAVHQILRMGIYQIYYMDAVPDSAVCNESVRLAKKHGPGRLSGFVNGILRNIAREEEKNRPPRSSGLQYSMPEWLVNMWTDQLGEAETEKLLDSLMEIRPVSARLARCLTDQDREQLLDGLRGAGVIVTEGRWLPDCRLLRRTSDLRRLPGFAEGLWTIQDESSMLAVLAAGLTGAETVFDVCAAPGGKSFFAADLLKSCKRQENSGTGYDREEADRNGAEISVPAGRVFSFDLSRRKTDRIREGARRLHLDNVTAAERDARIFFPEDRGKADVLLCDLPCSGLGVIGKKRDIKYRASMEGLASLRDLQRQILANTVPYLRSGGILVYTTCTINRAENEENADWIREELGLIPEDLAPYLPGGLPGIRGNMVQLLPHVHGTDGFFISRFRKP